MPKIEHFLETQGALNVSFYYLFNATDVEHFIENEFIYKITSSNHHRNLLCQSSLNIFFLRRKF